MRLHSFYYYQYKGEKKEWILERSSFNKINLIVGKNTSGKTRTLNVISGLAKLIRSETELYLSGSYEADFKSGDNIYNYILEINDRIVTHEKLTINNEVKLTRDIDGKGFIYTEEVNKDLKLKVNENQLALVIKRDPEQHSFLESIHHWASSVRENRFSNDNEKNTLASFQKNINRAEQKNNCIYLLKDGIEKFGEKFKSNILLDMNAIDFNLTDIGLKQPEDIIITEGPPIHLIYVKEKNLDCLIEQVSMSNGMFRALSLIIRLNYILLENHDSLLTVDDIGEGLDFNRAQKLVKLVINKAETDKIQLIMSTNDQFIMNGVPLEYWAIAERKEGNVKIITKEIAPDAFEKFKYIGLNNFEFFASEFYKS